MLIAARMNVARALRVRPAVSSLNLSNHAQYRSTFASDSEVRWQQKLDSCAKLKF